MARRKTDVAWLLLVWVGWVGGAHAASSQAPVTETVVELRVHGNQRVSDEEVLAWAGVAVGDRVGADVVLTVEERLQATRSFESVEVRKRYVSLTAIEEVALIVVVRERAVLASRNPFTRLFGELAQQALFLPIFDYTEGYGVTYGIQTSFVNVLGDGGRISIPATWGGTKRIELAGDKHFTSAVIDRLQGGATRWSRENPHYALDADRTEVWLRADRMFGDGRLRTAFETRWGDVKFGTLDESLAKYRVTLEVDTRQDPVFPRDAVRMLASYEWLDVGDRSRIIGRPHYLAEAYLGLVGQSVLAARASFLGADGALPPYEQPLLGGGASLRGWEVGEFAGDRRVNASVELRFPLSSPLSFGRAGATFFYDTGATYDVGQSLDRAQFAHGAGVGLFLHAAVIRLRLDIAHNLVDKVRIHLGAAISF